MTKTKSENFDWDRFNELISSSTAQPPANAIQVGEFAAKMKMSENGARKILDGKVRIGEMRKGNFRTPGKAGSWCAYFWFPGPPEIAKRRK